MEFYAKVFFQVGPKFRVCLVHAFLVQDDYSGHHTAEDCKAHCDSVIVIAMDQPTMKFSSVSSFDLYSIFEFSR